MLQFNHNKFKYGLFAIFLLGCLQLPAQELATEQQNRALLQQVEEAYNVGHFTEVIDQLQKKITTLSGVSRVTAYRLLALSALQLDESLTAEYYTKQMLDADPYYTTTLQDPPRFVDLINQFKNNGARITTASFQAESLEESPVPVTLITEDMIKASGARTVNELLAIYVPGTFVVEGVETNIGLRGIYASRQETMLIMLNGQRLNSTTSNSESLDYRTNIDKIKQIEILRGPASSLYGNVALTAAINIITKNGSDYDGITLTGQAGLNHSYGANFVGGKSGVNFDFLAWGSIYTSAGETFTDKNATLNVGGYNNSPSYDVGVKARWNDFTAQVTAQSSKRVPIYNQIQVPPDYDYDSYHRIDGVKPGLTYSQFHGTLGYQHEWKNLSLNVEASGVRESSSLYNVLGDTIPYNVADLLHAFMALEKYEIPIMTRGVYESLYWTTFTVGVNARMAWQYQLSEQSHGTLLAGVNYERFEQLVGDLKLGDQFGDRIVATTPMFELGTETTSSAFLQVKHHFNTHFILNSGVRYDYKHRYDDTQLRHVSPRLSLIYLPNQSLAFKAGWAQSFVDAPYIYRACNLDFYRGSHLQAETMSATQLGFSYNHKPSHLRYEMNLFHNVVSNIIHSDITQVRLGSAITNSGKVSTIGMEHVLEYTAPKMLVNFNLTWQKPITVEGLHLDAGAPDYEYIRKNRIPNVPELLINATVAQKVLDKKWGKLWVRGNVHAQSATYSEYLTLEAIYNAINGKYYDVTFEHQPFYAKINAGVDYDYKQMRFSLSAYNLLNYRSYIGGSVQALSPQEGFNFLGKVSFSF